MDLKDPKMTTPTSVQPGGRKKGQNHKQSGDASGIQPAKEKANPQSTDKHSLSDTSKNKKPHKTPTQVKHIPSNGFKKAAPQHEKPHDKRDRNKDVKEKSRPSESQQSSKSKSSAKQKSKAVTELVAEVNTEEYRKMLQSYPIAKLYDFMLKHGLEDPLNYTSISSDILVKQIGDFYYCALCCKRSRLTDPMTIDGHLESKQHMEAFLELRNRIHLTLPKDESIQSVAAGKLLNSWIQDSLLDELERERRTIAIGEFSNIVIEFAPECKYRVIGSFLTGVSQRNSDVNIELLHPNTKLFETDPRNRDSVHHKLVDPDAEYGFQVNNHTLHYDLIGNAVESLHKIASVLYSANTNFQVMSNIDDLTTKIPELTLFHTPTQTILRVCCYAESNYRLSCLLRNYLLLDVRALELSMLVKFWANLCSIGNPRHGTFSSDTLLILVIHFLQRTQPPVLPCLHDLLRKKSRSKSGEPNQPPDQLEDLINSLKIGPSTDEDDNVPDVDHSSPTEKQPEGEDSDALEKGILDEGEDDDEICNEFDLALIEELNWSSKNCDSVCKLFIKFLKAFMSEFAQVGEVISIRTLKPVTMASKHWNTQVKAVENPVRPRVNLTRTVGSYQTFNYIRQCFSYAFYYLTSIPQPNHQERKPGEFGKLYINLKKFDFFFNMKESQIKGSSKCDTISEMVQQDLFAKDIEAIHNIIGHFIANKKELDLIPDTVFRSYQQRHLIPRDFNATTYCWFCKKNGHTKDACPDKNIDREVNTSFDYMLDRRINFDRGFMELYTQDMISAEMVHAHHQVIRKLEGVIRLRLGLDVELTLFGSTVNLLGSHDSDLDICMTLADNSTGNGVDCVEILGLVSQSLRSDPEVSELEPILAARVPIIRFHYMHFDIDLCMYNQCAIHNSRLLKSYVRLNFKVAQLFYLVKRYAKSCGIADASMGSLSSYAWSLLVIHFLQNTHPPMLPVLQEPPANEPKKVFGVAGWNVWFNEDIGSYQMPKKEGTLTSLLKEFLLYYTKFDFNQRVVSIRTNRVITKFQKNWHNCTIAIEDPFELTYNLSGRLDEQMATYILQSFPRAYQNICQVQNNCFSQQIAYPPLHIVKTIFQGSFIMSRAPPYRGCRFCHKIGHRVADCPSKSKKKPKEEQNDKPKDKIKARASKSNQKN